MEAKTAKPFLTPEEFRTIVLQKTIGKNSLYELIHANRIKHIRIGRKILIPRSEVAEFARRESGIAEA